MCARLLAGWPPWQYASPLMSRYSIKLAKLQYKMMTQKGCYCSLATLYAASNMPIDQLKANAALDKAVDAPYGYKGDEH